MKKIRANTYYAILLIIIAAFTLSGCGSKSKDESPMVFADGKAQPIISVSPFRDEDYTNEDSEIIRYCVYVETDNDTDNDGKADLVKVFMQVPRFAVEGKYKAATIYDPTPYGAGTTNYFEKYDNDINGWMYEGESFDYSILYKDCEKRVPASAISTSEYSKTVTSKDWNKVPKGTSLKYGFENADEYDYYLARGFAVACCSGIGTYGSEGFELCGLDLERDSHKCVVEWLSGDRKAYTNKTDNIEISAEWSNNCVAMTGVSYGGTMPYEVATTGVEGLKTVIPVAGIASWYEYTNCQGISLSQDKNYTDLLAVNNAGGTFADEEWTVINDDYARYLLQVKHDQEEANGNYTEIWKASDYSNAYEKIKCSAMIVHGLNDHNVYSKHADLMYNAFKAANMNVKMVLHQNGHEWLNGFKINGVLWEEIVNEWLCHYLYGIENGIENMPEVTVQNNLTGEYSTYERWRDFNYSSFKANTESEFSTITTIGWGRYCTNAMTAGCSKSELFLQADKKHVMVYDLEIPEGTTIFGVPEINLTLSVKNADMDGQMITAALIDTVGDGEIFKAYNNIVRDFVEQKVPYKIIGSYKIGKEDSASGDVLELVQSNTDAKMVSIAWTDLNNPDKGYYSRDYIKGEALEEGKEYTYHIYLMPTVYTLAPGHTLKLIIGTWDPFYIGVDSFDEELPENNEETNNYSFTINNQKLDVQLPTR